MKTSADWKTAAISPTCEVLLSLTPVQVCDLPTEKVYPAAGGGWMALCLKHGVKHTEAYSIEDVIASGERFQ